MRKVFYPVSHAFLTRIDTAMDTHYWANWGQHRVRPPSACCATTPSRQRGRHPFQDRRQQRLHPASRVLPAPRQPRAMAGSRPGPGHSTLGIALTGAICEMAWNQGIDLYGYDNNRFLAGAEYVAKANLKQADGTFYTVPFVTYQNSAGVTQTQFSTGGRGDALGGPAGHWWPTITSTAKVWRRLIPSALPNWWHRKAAAATTAPTVAASISLATARSLARSTPAATPTGLTGYASAGKAVLSVGQQQRRQLQREARHHCRRAVQHHPERYHRSADLYRSASRCRHVFLCCDSANDCGRIGALQRSESDHGAAAARAPDV